jgi:hypothetical protein
MARHSLQMNSWLVSEVSGSGNLIAGVGDFQNRGS